MALAIRCNLLPGDLGRIVELHGRLYDQEFALDITFESYVAHGLAEWVNHRTERDRIWIAEQEEQLLGCVAIVAASEHEARLRWFLVHPSVRGQGLGTRLLGEAVSFCRESGYRSVFLGTFSALTSAARLYRAAGFEKVEERAHRRWGGDLVEEWHSLQLQAGPAPTAFRPPE